MLELIQKNRFKEVKELIKDYTLKSPVFIPSCNLRKKNIFQWNRDCIGVIYQDEVELYRNFSNRFIIVNPEEPPFYGVKSIQAKRRWIQEYCLQSHPTRVRELKRFVCVSFINPS